MIIPDIAASPNRTTSTIHNFTPTFSATPVSMNKLCEKDNMTAMMNTSFTVNSNDKIPAIPAYKLSALPSTNGIAASPLSPNIPINGAISLIIQGNTGVCCKMTTSTVIGNMIFPSVQVVRSPAFNPFCKRPHFPDPFLLILILHIDFLNISSYYEYRYRNNNRHDRYKLRRPKFTNDI